MKTLSAEKRDTEAKAAQPVKYDASPVEVAQYIAEFTAELSYLARKGRLDLLAYLLDMARLEAIRTVQAEGRKA
ncbi:hypothetical protein I2H38_11770 [Microvirga sp. BT350]|uniref:Uncharacterized protein n=1 Tax=Microvirga alba TaxID=2791025 RepID=A0A931BQ87_9HYPH|nr:hypothetical protein [Microvirga alba]